MAANKSKKQFQGKNRRFRGDVWLDEKVSARTMYALQERGKKRSRKGSAGSSPAARSRRNCSVINGYTICLGTDLYK